MEDFRWFPELPIRKAKRIKVFRFEFYFDDGGEVLIVRNGSLPGLALM